MDGGHEETGGRAVRGESSHSLLKTTMDFCGTGKDGVPEA